MCFSKPPKIQPIASAPTAGPEVIDDTAISERDRLRKKQRGLYGRQSTLLAGADTAAPPGIPTAPIKTALGS